METLGQVYLHRQHCRLPIPNPNYSETSKLVYIYIDIDCPSLGLLDTPNLAFIKFSVLLKLLGGRTNEHPVQTHTYLHIYLFLHIFKTKLIHEMCLIPQPGCSPYNAQRFAHKNLISKFSRKKYSNEQNGTKILSIVVKFKSNQ